LRIQEDQLAPGSLRPLRSGDEEGESGRVEIPQVGEIQDDVDGLIADRGGQGCSEKRSCRDIQLADQADDDRSA
jgi:hypothetical protein